MPTIVPSAAGVRLQHVNERIDAAATEAGRDREAVRLIAVSKTFDAEVIVPVLDAGQRAFGENRVQEAKAKWPELKQRYENVELHLIGPLQSNKVADAVALFDCIHTVDRAKIAQAIAAEMKAQGRNPTLFVEVNTGEEAQKAGVTPREVAAFVAMCRGELGLEIAGLMCIPPVEDEPAVHFAFLAALAHEAGVARLSMGMSADFETAVELGATDVRVGSAIFGGRT